MKNSAELSKHYLLASDFDQTLSFNDSGVVLSEMLGATDFQHKVQGLSSISLVQQGGELAYLLLHDPEYRKVRKHHLVEVGRKIRLKANIALLAEMLQGGIPGYALEMFVISAAPEEVIQSALDGIVPADHIRGTQFHYDPETGEIQSIHRVPAGYGKVAVLEQLQAELQIPHDRVVYVGDGSSDIHVMLHVNHCNGLTIAVSEARRISQIAKRTVLSHDTLSILVPILEDAVGYGPDELRALLQSRGLVIQEWEKGRTDWVTIRPTLHRSADPSEVEA
jgi:phosphoserine phosphatase